MSEPLFTAFLLGALVLVLEHRRSAHAHRYAVLAGVVAGLMVLTRANSALLLVPLALAVRGAGPWRSWRTLVAPAALVAVAALTIAPWTVRNARVMHGFVPVSTQLGSALAGTYNDDARADRVNPASWRSLRRIAEYRDIVGPSQWPTVGEVRMEGELRDAALDYAAAHPAYVGKVALWDTLRMLDLAGRTWSRHTASTISVSPRWADAGVACFWLFAVVALAGALTPRGRRIPPFVAAVPVLLYLSVVFMVFETPRYRTGMDPFIVLLAAVAVVEAWDGAARRRAGRSEAPAPAPGFARRLPGA